MSAQERPLGHSYVRGHAIRFDVEFGKHVFVADGKPVPAEGGEEPPCPFCGKTAGKGGVDPCLGILPRVESACCGHGEHEGWIRFEQGPTLAVRVEYPGTWRPT